MRPHPSEPGRSLFRCLSTQELGAALVYAPLVSDDIEFSLSSDSLVLTDRFRQNTFVLGQVVFKLTASTENRNELVLCVVFGVGILFGPCANLLLPVGG